MEPVQNGLRALSSVLVGADVVLMLAVAVSLLLVAFVVVRRKWPDCTWMVVLAGVLEAVSVISLQAVAPAVLRHYEPILEQDLGAVLVVPAALSLFADVLQVVVVGLLAGVLLRVAKRT